MSQESKIEWTGETWNPIVGCTKVSSGCTYCYAERDRTRLKAMGVPQYQEANRVGKHKTGRHLHGNIYDGMPAAMVAGSAE